MHRSLERNLIECHGRAMWEAPIESETKSIVQGNTMAWSKPLVKEADGMCGGSGVCTKVQSVYIHLSCFRACAEQPMSVTISRSWVQDS